MKNVEWKKIKWYSYPVLLVLIGVDMLFTLISRAVVGDWSFEENPLLPNHVGKFVLANALLVATAEEEQIRKGAVITRVIAILTHPIMWILMCSGFDPHKLVRKEYKRSRFVRQIICMMVSYGWVKYFNSIKRNINAACL